MTVEGARGFRLRFLGGCEILGPVGPVRLESAKTTAVLIRLALAGGREPRGRLVGWLWPELSEERAAANLRRAIWDLRRRLLAADGTPLVAASRTDLSLDPSVPCELDVAELRAALAAARTDTASAVAHLRRAAELYRGELLAGFYCDGAPELEDWLLLEREALGADVMAGLERLVTVLRAAGGPQEALAWARRAAALDPWREWAHQAVIEILAAGGERTAALAQYETLRRLLAEELQTEPAVAITRLAEHLRSEAPPGSTGFELPTVNTLPASSTPFVGRRAELEELEGRLADPACRLLSLVGPGGIGKTRLAVQAAQRLLAGPAAASPAADGVAYLPPLPGGHPGRLVAALSAALGLPSTADDGIAIDPERRLVEVLRERRLLVLVDGAEHLGDERELLSRLLSAATELTVLTTTRERLHLPGEWVVEVAGLGVPASAGHAGRGDAVELFLQAARRASVGFDPDPTELAVVERLCRRLGGSPLAIELAAGWLGPYRLAELEGELESDLSLLEAPGLGGQWSLEAMFDASFERLDDQERRALLAVSVFGGRMERADAARVAGVGPRTVAALTDRSFLRREPSGRLVWHEVLQHFARRRLVRDPELEDAARTAHARLFADRAIAWGAELEGGGRRATLEAVEAEVDNLRVAWRRAVEGRDRGLLEALLDAVVAACELGGRFEEGDRLLAEALASVADRPLRCRLLVARAGFRNRLASYADAEVDATAVLALAVPEDGGRAGAWARFHLADAAYLQGRFGDADARLEALAVDPEVAADPALAAAVWGRSGRVALEVGRLDRAEGAFAQALTAARAAGLEANAGAAIAQLGHVAYFRGDLAAAAAAFDEARSLASAARDPATTVQALQGLAYVAEDRGELDEAAALYQDSLVLCRAAGDRRGVAYTRMLLGENARRRRRFDEAREQSEAALAAAHDIGSQYLIGLLLGNLAYVEAEGGELDVARRRVHATLIAFRDSGSFTVALPALIALAEVRRREGRPTDALALLGLVAAHPANRQDHQLEVERVAAPLRRELPPGLVEGSWCSGGELDLEDIVDRVLEELAG